jgi:hypothetical protein
MLEYSPFGLASCFPTSAPDQLGRDGFEERLHLGIIITIAFGAHGYCDAVFGDTLLAAIETYPEVQFPQPFAEAHFGMAETLFDHGLHAEDAPFELYFMRAIHSVTQARKSLRSKVIPNDGRTYNVDLAASSGIMRDEQTPMLQNTI